MIALPDKTKIKAQLKKDEGFTEISVWDNHQYSYGYGCKAPGEGIAITKEEACDLLDVRVNQSIKEFSLLIRDFNPAIVDLTETRANALVNMLFNLGKVGVEKFTQMLKAIKENDWYLAAVHARNSLWYHQVGNRAERICKELQYG